MTITNGYTTLDNIKALLRIKTTPADTTEDALLERMVENASRLFDGESGRTFYARSETRYFDVPTGRSLWLDDDLLTVTAITNGDGTEIADTEYILEPRNGSPKYKITLKQSSSVRWTTDGSGNTEGVIAVEGSWGYASSAPADVRGAVESIVTTTYRSRYGQNVQGAAQVTAAGVVITPQDIPAEAWAVIRRYRRIV